MTKKSGDGAHVGGAGVVCSARTFMACVVEATTCPYGIGATRAAQRRAGEQGARVGGVWRVSLYGRSAAHVDAQRDDLGATLTRDERG